MKLKLPKIGITMGDPVGIGPEIVLSAHKNFKLHSFCNPVVLGDAGLLETLIHKTDSSLELNILKPESEIIGEPGILNLINLSALNHTDLTWGVPTKETGAAMISYIKAAAEYAMNGTTDAMTTSPVTKTAMKLGGSLFHGHTEYLAHLTGTDNFRMMMAGDKLKIVLVTIHIPLKDVSEALTLSGILDTIVMTNNSLKRHFGIKNPRIAVAGFNPHAGEQAMFGSEENEIIIPAVNKARESGIYTEGPFPPDTVYKKATDGHFDSVISMYHDQGLIPFKMVHFEDGVNTTLGLPIIRTSVDHGTAYDIAGKGIANPQSLVAAIKMAAEQATKAKN